MSWIKYVLWLKYNASFVFGQTTKKNFTKCENLTERIVWPISMFKSIIWTYFPLVDCSKCIKITSLIAMPAGRVFAKQHFMSDLIWAILLLIVPKFGIGIHKMICDIYPEDIRTVCTVLLGTFQTSGKSILLMRNTNNTKATHFDVFELQRNIHHFFFESISVLIFL